MCECECVRVCVCVCVCVCVYTWSQASLQGENSAAWWQQEGSADRHITVGVLHCYTYDRLLLPDFVREKNALKICSKRHSKASLVTDSMGERSRKFLVPFCIFTIQYSGRCCSPWPTINAQLWASKENILGTHPHHSNDLMG